MTVEQQRIWDFLVENAQGIKNAKHINEIAKAIGVSNYGTNNDNVRYWIKDMVITHHLPIGTCQKGAFIILNDEELEIAIRFVNRDSKTESIRNNGIYKP